MGNLEINISQLSSSPQKKPNSNQDPSHVKCSKVFSLTTSANASLSLTL